MSILLKVAVTAFVYIVLSIILKPYRPEYVFLLRVFTIILVFSFITDYLSALISEILSIFIVFNIESQHISLLLKVVGITIVTDFVSDTLIDNGEVSVANVITLTSKIIVLYLTIPLLKGLLIFCLKFIE